MIRDPATFLKSPSELTKLQHLYQDAKYKGGYTNKLEFKPPQKASSQRRNRSREIIWFNPPSIGREFLRLIDKCFPIGHKLRNIFIKNSLKLGQSCMPKVQQIINGHNKTVLKNPAQPTQDQPGRTYICRKKEVTAFPKESFIRPRWHLIAKPKLMWGLQPQDLKQGLETIRCRSTTSETRKNTDTELSKHVWQLKSNQQHFTIKWKILVKAKPYSNQTKRCNLCKLKDGKALHHHQTGTAW